MSATAEETVAEQRRRAVERASRSWQKGLLDVSGSNRLLFFKPTAATLNLEGAERRGVAELLGGEWVPIARLFPDPQARQKASTALRKLAAKQAEARDEFGIDIAHLAMGFVTWAADEDDPAFGAVDAEAAGDSAATPARKRAVKKAPPNAPLLLRTAEIAARPGGAVSVRLTGEPQVNGVLLHVLADRGVVVDEQALLLAGDDESGDLTPFADHLTKLAHDIPGFAVLDGQLLGAFTYLKQPMVEDCQDIDALAANDLVAALAGDLDSLSLIKSQASDISEQQPDYAPVDAEHLILDADASQSYVVNAALAGRNLVVQGPPGTGKSQTIANIIACLIAEQRSVLFVAQKRAAITAVLERLERRNLGDLCLDLFAAGSSRRYVSEQLARILQSQASIPRTNTTQLSQQLTTARDRLVHHKDALVKPRAWGISVSQCFAISAGLPAAASTGMRIPTAVTSRWTDGDLERHAADLDELSAKRGLDPDRLTRPGWSIPALTTAGELQQANEALSSIRSEVAPRTRDALAALAAALGVAVPLTIPAALEMISEAEEAAALCAAAPSLMGTQGLPIADEDLERMSLAVDKGYRHARGIKMGFGDRRRGRKQAQALLPHVAADDVPHLLQRARSVRSSWRQRNYMGSPRPLSETTAARQHLDGYSAWVAHLQRYVQNADLHTYDLPTLDEIYTTLADDSTRFDVPRCHDLENELNAAGVTPVISWLRRSGAPAGVAPGDVLRAAVVEGILEEARTVDPGLANVTGRDLHQASRTFTTRDSEHLEANAHRVRRAAAERLRVVLNANDDQRVLVQRESTRKRGNLSARKLFEKAPEVLTAAAPCWAMSPLQVSRMLPNRPCFDVVIFDEASQVRPPDAIPSLVRGKTVIVAGDSRQLPPTEFFTKLLEDDGGAEDEEDADLRDAPEVDEQPRRRTTGALTDGAESILAAFDIALGGQSRRLQWHYRSRDERLIAVSNTFVYDGSLTTFPSAGTADIVRHEVVPPSRGVKGVTSPQAEVDRVVALALDHLRDRPEESLGIICCGVVHANRVDAALDAALANEPLLAEAADRPEEPLFVKNIERVQGDERDAVILSVGYGKDPGGKLRLFWGPLLKPGGERRLNVAISRARRSMTLVTSFAPEDLAEDGHPSQGYQLMYRFIRFMGSGGTELDRDGARVTPLNAFEIDMRDRLVAAGLDVVPQWGVGRYRIDFAIRHPERPGQFLLAVEADGAMYHSGTIARERDRLRQELLEARGWRFHRVWSTDWFNDADAEVQKIVTAYRDALRAAETPETTRAAESAPAASTNEAPAWTLESQTRQGARPPVRPGLLITQYSHQELVQLARWLRSDGVVRTRDQELALMMDELGFRNRGRRIVAAIEHALDRA